MFIYDTVIFLLTLSKVLQQWRVGRSTLANVIIRDGELPIVIFSSSLTCYIPGVVYYLLVLHCACSTTPL